MQKALDEGGSSTRWSRGRSQRGKREELKQLSGQSKYPVIEFEDGTTYREDSKDMAARIRAGKLSEADKGAAAT